MHHTAPDDWPTGKPGCGSVFLTGQPNAMGWTEAQRHVQPFAGLSP